MMVPARTRAMVAAAACALQLQLVAHRASGVCSVRCASHVSPPPRTPSLAPHPFHDARMLLAASSNVGCVCGVDVGHGGVLACGVCFIV